MLFRIIYNLGCSKNDIYKKNIFYDFIIFFLNETMYKEYQKSNLFDFLKKI